MKTLAELIQAAHATAKSKGWHDVPLVTTEDGERCINHDGVLAKHALIHSELTELDDSLHLRALPTYFDHDKPEGWLVEAADVLIRIFDLVGALDLPLAAVTHWDASGSGGDWLVYAKSKHAVRFIVDAHKAGAEYLVAQYEISGIRRSIDQATEAARVDDWDEYIGQMASAVIGVAAICFGLGQDIGPAIEVKMRYNETRSHRHGGKKA